MKTYFRIQPLSWNIFGRIVPAVIVLTLVGSHLAFAGTLWRRDGLPNIAGPWVFKVGARGHSYRVQLTQTGMLVGGYMTSPAGKRFNFVECGSMSDDCSFVEGNGTTWWLRLREGESLWAAQLGRGGGSWGFDDNHGTVTNVYSGKVQAVFAGRKL